MTRGKLEYSSRELAGKRMNHCGGEARRRLQREEMDNKVAWCVLDSLGGLKKREALMDPGGARLNNESRMPKQRKPCKFLK
jgi:hypothetical protein